MLKISFFNLLNEAGLPPWEIWEELLKMMEVSNKTTRDKRIIISFNQFRKSIINLLKNWKNTKFRSIG